MFSPHSLTLAHLLFKITHPFLRECSFHHMPMHLAIWCVSHSYLTLLGFHHFIVHFIISLFILSFHYSFHHFIVHFIICQRTWLFSVFYTVFNHSRVSSFHYIHLRFTYFETYARLTGLYIQAMGIHS